MSGTICRTVLLIEGNAQEAASIREMLRPPGSHAFELAHVEAVSEAMTHLTEHVMHVILLDLGSAGVEGKDTLRQVRQAAPRVSIVLRFSLAAKPMARQAMRDGAQDYLIKGEMQSQELVRALENAIERKAIEESLFEEKERAQVTLDSMATQ